MADGMTTMFGKAYDTVGSADKNLILQTRGDLKVKWGGKYIDLIKNGKINVDIDFLKKVDDKESIYKDGVYLVEKEDKQEVWISIGGTLVNLLGEVGTSYVSFLEKQDVKIELKSIALSNIGFYYDTLEDAQNAKIQKGIVYILETNKLYYAKDEVLIEYKQDFTIPDPLTIGGIVIDGTSSTIKGAPLSFGYGDVNYINFTDKGIVFAEAVTTLKDLLSEDYLQGQTGFALFHNTEDNQTYLEIDVVRIRSELDYINVKDITYKELRSLVNSGKLVKGKKYRITDFINEWELKEYYTKHNSNTLFHHYWPVILTADSKRTFKKEGYFCDREDWIIEYDINFYYYSHVETSENGQSELVYSKGRITRLTDEFGNSGNFDFKHHLFKYTSGSDDPNQWFYTYNINNDLYNTGGDNADIGYDDYLNTHVNRDASQLGLIKNNTIYIKEPFWENGVDDKGLPCKKLVLYDDYIIFPNCASAYPHDNKILASSGKYTIPGQFYGNTIQGLLLNVTTREEVTFNFEFLNNTCGNIYMIGEYVAPTILTDSNTLYEVYDLPSTSTKRTTFTDGKLYIGNTFLNITGCQLDASMQNNIFDKDLLDVNFKCNLMENNHITGTIFTENGATTYPIEIGTFSNNVINNITKSKIMCFNCSFINNIFHNIVGYFFENTSVTDSEIEDLIGDDSVAPDNPVNPEGSGDSVQKYGITWYTISPPSPGSGYTLQSILENNLTYYAWIPNTFISGGVTYYLTQPANPGSGYTLSTIQQYGTTYYAYVNQESSSSTTDADVEEYLTTFKASSLSSTSLGDSRYALLSTAMDKLDSFESSVMSDSMFVDDALTLPSGNSTDTRNARRGWFMALLLTALYPLKNSAANNDILSDAMSTWGISQSTNTNTYSVSTYEAKYKGLLQGSIAFSWLFGDSSFTNSFASFTSYSYLGSDGDLGPESRAYAPAGQYFFPYPPTNNINATSGLMKRDEDAFKHGLDLRSTSRGTTALYDRDTDLSYFLSILQTATGKNYSSGSAYTFMHDTQWDGKRTVNNIKNADGFWRSRPAWENNDTSVDGSPTESGTTYSLNFGTASGKSGSTSHTTSYPSGHTGYFWNTAYCFAAIGGLSSSAVVNLFKRAYQYSESRVVVGAHWQMCVEMGRIAAACSFATLCGNTKFIQELLAALS